MTDRRRWLQLGLAAVWLYAGFLQMQTFMFSADFAKMTLEPVASGNPSWVAHSILWAAHIVAHSPLTWNVVFVLVQVLLGVGIAFRPTARVALGGSVIWALIVWWFGEGLGGLLTGTATVLTGAPGGVLLYALIAIMVWPASERTPDRLLYVARWPLGLLGSRLVWLVLWGGFAALNLQPANLTSSAVHDAVSGMGDGQPHWITDTVNAFAAASNHNGIWLTLLGTAILTLVALGVVLPPAWLRACVILALVTAAFIWLFGEALGAVFGGQATDPNSAPLLALIALAYLPFRRAGVSASGEEK